MWKVIAFVTLCHGMVVIGRNTGQLEGLSWSISSNTGHLQRNLPDDIYKSAYSYYIPKNKGDDYDIPQPTHPKRGLSLLARWRPFNNIGKNRSSIRDHNNKLKALVDQDVVMETRAHSRLAGQPLRWG